MSRVVEWPHGLALVCAGVVLYGFAVRVYQHDSKRLRTKGSSHSESAAQESTDENSRKSFPHTIEYGQLRTRSIDVLVKKIVGNRGDGELRSQVAERLLHGRDPFTNLRKHFGSWAAMNDYVDDIAKQLAGEIGAHKITIEAIASVYSKMARELDVILVRLNESPNGEGNAR